MRHAHKQGPRQSGFTLIELMIVVAIIGVLASIALPKFADMVLHAKEAAVKGQLGGLRSAVSIYYADNEGLYPISVFLNISLTTNSKYLQVIPYITIPSVTAQANPGHNAGDCVYDTGRMFSGCFVRTLLQRYDRARALGLRGVRR